MELILECSSKHVRTYGVNQVYRFVKGIRLHRQRPILLHTCAACFELPSYMSTIKKPKTPTRKHKQANQYKRVQKIVHTYNDITMFLGFIHFFFVCVNSKS